MDGKPFFPNDVQDDHLLMIGAVMALPIVWFIGAWLCTFTSEALEPAGTKRRRVGKTQRYDD